MSVLEPGARFPTLTVRPAAARAFDLPAYVHGHFAVVLFYRGSWCPYCNAQLRAFQRATDDFVDAGIRVVAISVDDEPTTQALIAKHGLAFPVGHSADARAIAAATGAFVNPKPLYLQATGFVLDRDGSVIVSVYSSGAIGRLLPEDVLGLVRYLQTAHHSG